METDLRIEVGVMFPNKKQLKAACQTLATRENFEYTVTKSDKSRMIIMHWRRMFLVFVCIQCR